MTLTVGRTDSIPRVLATALFALMLLVAMAPAPAIAAAITWSNAENIQGDGDVSINGTLVYAYNFGYEGDPAGCGTSSNLSCTPLSVPPVTSTTINGVTFSAFSLPSVTGPGTPVTVGNVSISESPGDLLGALEFGSSTGAFGGLSSAYKGFLGTGALGAQSGTLTLVLGGLTIGQTYDFQWWSNDSSGNAYALDTVAEGAVGETPVTVNAGSGAVGALGQYAIGRFTADGNTQNISFDAAGLTGFPMINGFQLREGPFSVPAPSVGLMAVGGFCLILLWRRQRAR